MNGDSYSSSRDGGRHGSSRDYESRRDRGEGRRDRGDRDGGRDGGRDSGRRRSRSPDYRSGGGSGGAGGGGGRSRRDGREGGGAGGDVDAYSSSRSHREREREERYSGRDRRGGEREWDRDAGGSGRREGGRRDDDRHGGGRRERGGDLLDDRRGGPGGRRAGGGGGGDRDSERGGADRGGADRGGPDRGGPDRGGPDRGGPDRGGPDRGERRRSASPPPKKREPTPDLTDVVSVLERKRRLTQWDIKPPGYVNVTAEQAKLSGMFPLPGAPRQQVMDPTKLQAFMSQPGGSVNSAALKPTNSRQSKRLIVSNLPAGTTEDGLLSFFNLQLNGLNVIESSDPCVMCQLSQDGSFAMLEFRNSTDATVALAFDGISMEADDVPTNGHGSGSQGLIIKRPKDYIVPAVVDDVPYEPGVVSNVVLDTPNKISVANIPPYLTDEQVTELLVSFGELKAFILVKDSGTEESRGVAFCEYVDPSATEIAIQGLNGMELGDKKLHVQKASVGIQQVAGAEMGVNAMSLLAGTTSTAPDISRVIQLLNMVTPDELLDNEEYEEILEDVKDEVAKYGMVLDLKIPRPIGGSRQSAGVGKIFVKYDDSENATKALRALAGRKFADRTVVATYFPEENFDVGAW